MDKTTQRIIDNIERECEPSKMSKEQALMFLINIQTELDLRIECLKDELK